MKRKLIVPFLIISICFGSIVGCGNNNNNGTNNGTTDTINKTPSTEPNNTTAPNPTLEATNTPALVATNTPVPTAANTPAPTATNTPVPTAANTPALTATNTPVPTATNTPAPTATNTPVPTATNTPVPTATNTPVPTKAPAANNEINLTAEAFEKGLELRKNRELVESLEGREQFITYCKENRLEEYYEYYPDMPIHMLYAADGKTHISIFREGFSFWPYETEDDLETYPGEYTISYYSVFIIDGTSIDKLEGYAIEMLKPLKPFGVYGDIDDTVISLDSISEGVITDTNGNAIIKLLWDYHIGTFYETGYIADGYEACAAAIKAFRALKYAEPNQ